GSLLGLESLASSVDLQLDGRPRMDSLLSEFIAILNRERPCPRTIPHLGNRRKHLRLTAPSHRHPRTFSQHRQRTTSVRPRLQVGRRKSPCPSGSSPKNRAGHTPISGGQRCGACCFCSSRRFPVQPSLCSR